MTTLPVLAPDERICIMCDTIALSAPFCPSCACANTLLTTKQYSEFFAIA